MDDKIYEWVSAVIKGICVAIFLNVGFEMESLSFDWWVCAVSLIVALNVGNSTQKT